MNDDPIDRNKLMTNATGVPVDNDLNSITTGGSMPFTMLQDSNMIEKLAHFNRQTTPERIVHAKGAGAFGTFTVTRNMSKYTCADFLNKVGKKTNVFVRFSTVGGEKGSADAVRDPRGFAVKFYTNQGNYDIVGNNTPVFFIRDAIKFPDFVHTQKRNPQTNLPDPDIFWDFLSLTPESLHQVLILFSDRGTPKNYRAMDGFSSHTFLWYNDKKEYFWVKYHFKSTIGNQTLTAEESEKLSGSDPNSHTRDLFDAIQHKNFPQWKLYVQIMTPKQAEQYQFDPFDITKVWYKKDFPLQEIGVMTLNKNPENFFAEVEQAAFAPSHFVPGIGPSPDRLLQGRLFAYPDAHRWRLGSNNEQIPVNRPVTNATTHNYQRDGNMSVLGNGGALPNYYPNSFNASEPNTKFTPPQAEVDAIIQKHIRPVQDIDFVQPRALYQKVMNDTDRAHLIHNIVIHLGNAKKNLQYRQTALFYKCDPDFGTKISEQLKLDVNKVKNLSAMSQEKRVAATLNNE